MTEIIPRKGDLIYELTFFDEEGNEIGTAPHLTYSLESGIERQVQFMERSEQVGATSCSVRHLRPKEVHRLVRTRERQEFWDEVMDTSLGLIGLERGSILPVLIPMLDIQYREVES